MKENKKIMNKNVNELKDLIGGLLKSLDYHTKDFKTFTKEVGESKSIIKFGYKNKRLTCFIDYTYKSNRDYDFVDYDIQYEYQSILEIIKHTNLILELDTY